MQAQGSEETKKPLGQLLPSARRCLFVFLRRVTDRIGSVVCVCTCPGVEGVRVRARVKELRAGVTVSDGSQLSDKTPWCVQYCKGSLTILDAGRTPSGLTAVDA
jgi:hypothetical protein